MAPILSVYLFLLAVFNKRFVYLHLNVGPVPLYLTEIILGILLAWALFRRRAPWQEFFRPAPLFLGAYLIWGSVRLGIGLWEKTALENGITQTLKDFALVFQALWFFVPFLFERSTLRKIFVAPLVGASFAQVLGWLGFILMGSFNEKHTFLMGFPVGNELALSLYMLSPLLVGWKWSVALWFPFGHLWLTQFVLYMKRIWVFGCLAFSAPCLWGARRGTGIGARSFGALMGATLLSVVIAAGVLELVKGRDLPPYPFPGRSNLTARYTAPTILQPLLRAIEWAIPYTDPVESTVSTTRVLFKGDYQEDSSGNVSLIAFRMHLWRQALFNWTTSPIIGPGFGPRMFSTQLNGKPAEVNGAWISGPHNSFLAVLHRTGLIGLGLISVSLFLCIWPFVIRPRRLQDPWSAFLIAGAASALLFATFNVCLENPQGAVLFWLLLGALARAGQSSPTTASS